MHRVAVPSRMGGKRQHIQRKSAPEANAAARATSITNSYEMMNLQEHGMGNSSEQVFANI